MGSTIVVCLLLALINCVSSNSNVPVLIWNTQQPADASVPAVSALQQLSVASLQARYLDAFKPDNVLLFIQDALSIEDLSSHGAELEHVNAWMEAGHSLYVPNVMQPSQLQHDLVQQGYKVTSLAAGSAIAELKLDATEKNLVIVKLPPTITNPSRSRALRKTDEVMQSVISKVGSVVNFTVIYTGLKPSVDSSSDQSGSLATELQHQRVARSLKQFGKSTVPSGFHNGTCIWIYFRNNMTFSLNGPAGPFGPIPESIVTDNPVIQCLNQTIQTIQLNYDNVVIGDTTLHKLKLGFLFTRERTFWRSPLVQASIMKTSNSNEETHILQLMKWVDDSVPIGKSYACSVPLVYKEMKNVTNPFQLVINGVQVEAFKKDGTQFGPSWDCVGFFTIGIWSGLLASLISVLILSFGFAMLANIKTMDRFDDPKGKTIMIPLIAD